MDPGPIMRLATGYWESRSFLVANDVGIFERLANGPMTADALARSLGFEARPTLLLLRACVALELLVESSAGFENTPRTQLFLVPGSPAFLGNAVRYGGDMWEGWTQLEQALKRGEPPVRPESYTGEDPVKTRNFVLGMRDRAAGIASALVPLLDLSGRKRLLDIGGGPGTYSAMLAAANPDLHATVMDLPDVVAIAADLLAETDGGDRVDTLAGDYHTTPFPSGSDVVLISGVFHRETEDECRALIQRAAEVLAPGGMLAISDVFTDEGGASPVFAALFGLNMMLSAPDGGVHSDADVARWLEDAGFREVVRRQFPPRLPHRVVTGTL
jgi:SAM-dependent methyltransferase